MKRTLLPTHAFFNKALLLINLIILSVVNVLAQGPATPLPQNQQKWNTNGNSVTSTDFIGTTNATSLIFRTNNLKALEIDPNADLFLKNLSGTGNGIIRYDNLGKIERVPFNQNFSQVLSSSGVWSEISTLIGLQLNNTDIIQTAPGKVGIGTVSPMEKLHVNGNLRIDGDLILHNLNGQGEGIIKHDQNGKIEHIQFNNSFTQVLSSSGVWQEISTFTGLQVNNNDIIQTTSGNFGIGTSAPQAKLDVNGNAIISGSLLTSYLMLGTSSNNFQINTLALPAGGSVIAFGIGPNLPPFTCIPGHTNGNALFNRLTVINTSNNNVVDIRNDGNNGYIDFGYNPPATANPTAALKINSLCNSDLTLNENGGDVFMCNPSRGKVGIGTSNTPYKKLTVNGDVSFANYNISGSGNSGDGMNGLEILGNNQTPTRRGISLDPDPNGSFNFFIHSWQNQSAFNFKNGYDGATLMMINETGNVGIGTSIIPNGIKLAVCGTIQSKEVIVDATSWCDYVFANNYKKMSIGELETYINIYKHLPDFPSETEVLKNGVKLLDNQKQLLKTIETQALYIIEMNNKLDALQKQIELLQK